MELSPEKHTLINYLETNVKITILQRLQSKVCAWTSQALNTRGGWWSWIFLYTQRGRRFPTLAFHSLCLHSEGWALTSPNLLSSLSHPHLLSQSPPFPWPESSRF